MKKAKEFLRDIMIINERSVKISDLMKKYQEDEFESKVTAQDLDQLIGHLNVIIEIREKRDFHHSKLIQDKEAREYLECLIQKS